MDKYTLAIETSCDDTSISIHDGIEVISLKTFSQIKHHQKFGGVIPEFASRLHSKFIFDLIKISIEDSGKTLKDMDRIAVTVGPGLVNTLQVGITIAKTLAFSLGIPLYGINHIEAHAYSPFINSNVNKIPKKAIVLIVSGGHTQISIKDNWDFTLLGKTRDDSIGEAYDKVSKTVGLKYPGGPIIDKIYSSTKDKEIKCPVSNLEKYDFSYSGLKSFVALQHKKNTSRNLLLKGFQTSAISQLIIKVKKAMKEFDIQNVIVGGGVSANSLLRDELSKIDKINLFLPKIIYTGDNAAMIGYLAIIKVKENLIKEENLNLDAKQRIEI